MIGELIHDCWVGLWLFMGPVLLGWTLRGWIGPTLAKDLKRLVDRIDPTG